MRKHHISDSEIPEIQDFIKQKQAEDIQCWSYVSALNGANFKLVYRPSLNKFVVIDKSENFLNKNVGKHAEYHYDTIEEAVEKYNQL